MELVLECELALEVVSALSSVRKLALERLRKSERNEGAMAGDGEAGRLDEHHSSRERREREDEICSTVVVVVGVE